MMLDCINREWHEKHRKDVKDEMDIIIHHPENYKEGLQCKKSEDGYWCMYVNDGKPIEGSNIVITTDEMNEMFTNCIGYSNDGVFDMLIESEKFRGLLG